MDPIPITDMEDVEPFVGVHEVAALTSYSLAYIRELCAENKIPHHQARPGSALLFLVSEIRAWLRGEWEG